MNMSFIVCALLPVSKNVFIQIIKKKPHRYNDVFHNPHLANGGGKPHRGVAVRYVTNSPGLKIPVSEYKTLESDNHFIKLFFIQMF